MFCYEWFQKNDESVETMDISNNNDNVRMSIRIKTQHQNLTTQKHIHKHSLTHTHMHTHEKLIRNHMYTALAVYTIAVAAAVEEEK